jgi:uncharacterized protein YqgC (DUF456 family)
MMPSKPAHEGIGMDVVLWIVAVAMIVVGIAGTVLPALPGTVFIFGGMALAAWIDGFQRVSLWIVGIAAVLTAIAFAADYVAAVLGAKKAGASRLAIIGAALGTIGGLFGGLLGLIFLPLVGATIGEYVARRDAMHAGRVGMATWMGLLLGTAVKVAIAFTLVGMFVAALVF